MYRMDDAQFSQHMRREHELDEGKKGYTDRTLQHARELQAKYDAERAAAREKEQAERAEKEKETFLARARDKWRANGGDDASFRKHSEDMWITELKRRSSETEPSPYLKQVLSSYSF